MEKESITLNNGDWRLIRMTFNYLKNMRLPATTQLKIISIHKAIFNATEPFEEAIRPLYDRYAEKDANSIKTKDGKVIWKSSEDEAAFNDEYTPVAAQETTVEIDPRWKIKINELGDITFTGDALELITPFIEM